MMVMSVFQCRQQCLELESVVTAVQQRCSLREDMFPIIIGRRPNSGLNDSGKFSTTSLGTGSDDHNSSNNTDTNRPPTVSQNTYEPWHVISNNVEF